MKIEHIAIWVQDIDKVCKFYQKYFGGVIHPIYHNPARQFTSRFVTFESGARLEVMHRPDIDTNVGTVTSLTFHVKHAIARVAKICKHIFMTEHEHVGHEVSKHECLGYAHLSFSVGSKEKVDRLTQQMSADGIQIVGEPRTTGDGYYESVVLDPEGNRVEITI